MAFFYNKELVAKAGVDPRAIKTWADFLAAVKKLKEAGITPIIVGGGEKWPMHFYWSYLVMRDRRRRGARPTPRPAKDDGFNNPVFVQAGEKLQELAALEPFQEGWLATLHLQAAGLWGDGKGAFQLMGSWLLNTQKNNATDGKGLAPENIGIMNFPIVEGGKGAPTDTLGGINGWLITEGSPPEAIEFLKFFLQDKYQSVAAEKGFYIPSVVGTGSGDHRPAEQAHGGRPRRLHLPPDLLRPGSRPGRRARRQRHLGGGRRRRDDAGGRRRRRPGGLGTSSRLARQRSGSRRQIAGILVPLSIRGDGAAWR